MAAKSKTPDEAQVLAGAALAPLPPIGSNPQKPSPAMLVWAYGHGVFPMADPDTGRIDWYSPDPRGIIPLHPSEAFHIPKNLRRELRQQRFEIRCDTAFEIVMRACAHDRDESNRSWINDTIIAAYVRLHQFGFAHSVEAWLDEKLVGGLYGVHIGAAFFGESMFSNPDLGGTNSSKICLVHLVNHLRERDFTLLDTQFWNPHLDQFGCVEIPAEEYLTALDEAIRQPVKWQASAG